MLSLDELCDLMEEPTNYVSPLGQTDWFNEYIAPMTFRGVSLQLCNSQILLNDFLDRHDHALAEIFRGVGKTVLVEGRLTRYITENRDNNYAIQSENVERSMERLMVIRNHLTGNPNLIKDYGYLPLDKKYGRIRGAWKSNQITVKRDMIQTDPTLKAVSWKDARLLGGHFHGILFDDPWSSKLEENNEKNKEKWFRWYDSTLIGCMESDSWQHVICTRKGLYDIYRSLEDRSIFSLYKQPAIYQYPTEYEYLKDEQGKIINVEVFSNDWHISDDGNGRFSIEYFLMKKAQVDDSAFQMEWQLDPLPKKGRLFDWDDVNFFEIDKKFKELKTHGEETRLEWTPGWRRMRIVAAMDMAFGKSKQAHYTALAVCGYLDGEYYFLDGWIKKGTSKIDKAKMVRLALKEYPSIRKLYIEADFNQTNYIDDLKELLKGVVRIEEVLSRYEERKIAKEDIGKLSPKHARIYGQLDEVTEAGHFWVNKNMKIYGEFEREMKEFPRSLYDDLIDAVGSAISKLKRSRFKLWGASGR
jgi:phage terminase large subunit-like protein